MIRFVKRLLFSYVAVALMIATLDPVSVDGQSSQVGTLGSPTVMAEAAVPISSVPGMTVGEECEYCDCPDDPDGPSTCEPVNFWNAFGVWDCDPRHFMCCGMFGGSCSYSPDFAPFEVAVTGEVLAGSREVRLRRAVIENGSGTVIGRDCRGRVTYRTFMPVDQERLIHSAGRLVLR